MIYLIEFVRLQACLKLQVVGWILLQIVNLLGSTHFAEVIRLEMKFAQNSTTILDCYIFSTLLFYNLGLTFLKYLFSTCY